MRSRSRRCDDAPLSETTRDAEHVKRGFESRQTAFSEEIEQVREELDERFGEEGSKMREVSDSRGITTDPSGAEHDYC